MGRQASSSEAHQFRKRIPMAPMRSGRVSANLCSLTGDLKRGEGYRWSEFANKVAQRRRMGLPARHPFRNSSLLNAASKARRNHSGRRTLTKRKRNTMAAEDDTQTCRAEMSDHGAIDLRWDAPFELKTKTDEHPAPSSRAESLAGISEKITPDSPNSPGRSWCGQTSCGGGPGGERDAPEAG